MSSAGSPHHDHRSVAVNVAVVGAGAIGTALSVELAAAGRVAVLVCTRPGVTGPDRFRLQRPDGTALSCELSPLEAAPEATAAASRPGASCPLHPHQVGPVDVVLLATKAYQSPGARPWLEALVGPDTVVAVLQNGIDQVERISELVPPGTAVVPVVVMMAVDRHGPGEVHQAGVGLLQTPDTPAGAAVADLFAGTTVRVEAVADFRTRAWHKLLINAVVGGIGALTLRGLDVLADPAINRLARDLADEVVAVARAEGAALTDEDAGRALDRAVRNAQGHWSSISVDRREGRPLEWQVRNAPIGILGRRHAIPTPLNDLVTTLLRACDPHD
ncbi:MAG: ketopantoate reductase family protein [Acidimicrobiales bacterium]